jgi:hypothetical protein
MTVSPPASNRQVPTKLRCGCRQRLTSGERRIFRRSPSSGADRRFWSRVQCNQGDGRFSLMCRRLRSCEDHLDADAGRQPREPAIASSPRLSRDAARRSFGSLAACVRPLTEATATTPASPSGFPPPREPGGDRRWQLSQARIARHPSIVGRLSESSRCNRRPRLQPQSLVRWLNRPLITPRCFSPDAGRGCSA